MVLKYCMVPRCRNSSLKCKNKIFLSAPKSMELRKKWYEVLNIKDKITGHHLYICEDHFDLEKDAENWIYYKLMGRKIILKRDVVPHIFPEKREEESSQFTDAEKELKRKLLEKYTNDRLKPKKSNFETATSTSSNNFSIGTKITQVNKNLLSNAKSLDEEDISNDSSSSNETKPIPPEATIVPSRINIQIDPGLPELMYIRQESPERHQPLLLRRKKKNSKTKSGPEVVWINPPLVEISYEDQLEKSIKNAGTLANEEQLREAKLLKLNSEPKLEIKSESELGEIKQEETLIEDFKVEENIEDYLYPEINMDVSNQPDSVQAYLNVDPQPKDLPVSEIELKTEEASNIAIKEEPLDEPTEQTNDFEFVNVNIKQESSFFCEEPLTVPGKNIFVAKQTDESILS